MEIINVSKQVDNKMLIAQLSEQRVRELAYKELAFQIAEHIIKLDLVELIRIDHLKTTEFGVRFIVASIEEISELKDKVKLIKKLEAKVDKQNKVIKTLWEGRKDKQWKAKLMKQDLKDYLNIDDTVITQEGNTITIFYKNEIGIKETCKDIASTLKLIDEFKYLLYRYLNPKLFKLDSEIGKLSLMERIAYHKKEEAIIEKLKSNSPE